MSPGNELTADSTVLVVGASLAGWRAVETLRSDGFDGKISLIGEEQHLPYDRPPLSKQVLAGTWPPEKAVLADKRRSSEHRIHEVLGRRAVCLDAESRKVELDDGTILEGDGIVITTGARPRCAPSTTPSLCGPRSQRSKRPGSLSSARVSSGPKWPPRVQGSDVASPSSRHWTSRSATFSVQ
jgi:3-phenylpropionate/trans-cinnamate dioxygenase ferredoxin reductase subunit